jgi:hypothetical protein
MRSLVRAWDEPKLRREEFELRRANEIEILKAASVVGAGELDPHGPTRKRSLTSSASAGGSIRSAGPWAWVSGVIVGPQQRGVWT